MENKNFLRLLGLFLISLPVFSLCIKIFFPLDPLTELQLQKNYPNEIMPLWKSILIDTISLIGGIWVIIKANQFDKHTKSFSKEMKYLRWQQISSTIGMGTTSVLWILFIGQDIPVRVYFFWAGVTVIMAGWFFFIRQLIKIQHIKESEADEIN